MDTDTHRCTINCNADNCPYALCPCAWRYGGGRYCDADPFADADEHPDACTDADCCYCSHSDA